MKRIRRVTLHWGLLLAVYWSIVFASAMVALTASLNSLYLLAMLVFGVPVYFLASHVIMRQHDVKDAGSEVHDGAEIIPFPDRNAAYRAQCTPAQVAAEVSPQRRKLG